MMDDKREMVRIWKLLRQSGECEGIEISTEIRESWERSERLGVNPFKPCCDVILSVTELSERKDDNAALLEQASVMMGHLQRFTEGSGFVFTLADSEGYILKRIGDRPALDFAGAANLTEGANWSEQVMGTNSVGLALVLRRPVQVFGYEHFCLCASISTCAASPIFGEDHQPVGVLNITGPYHLVNRHTLGMAIAASRAIERQMALQSAYQISEMNNLHKTAIMESISDGVLTLDREARLTHLNLKAAENLGIDYHRSIGSRLIDLMSPENELFFSKITANRRLYAEPLLIRRRQGMVRLAVTSTPLESKDGKVLGTVVILQPMQQYRRLIERVSGTRAKITFNDILGQSREFRYAVKCAEMAASSDSNVLLLGESGVGKEMFAQSIHNASSRSREPFFAINCAALPRELVSSELFGYEEGAFTGARKGGNPGKFELADQGTIFLDEIGEMPLDLQGTLLRVLEEGTIIRLGGREVIPVNVRIIAATNKNLPEEVRRGNFRLDLYYRLGVINIKIPSLRERKGDIPLMVDHFIRIIGPKLGKKINHIEDAAMDIMLNYDWPGNVRELNNVLERAINMTTGDVLTAEVLPPEIRKPGPDFMPLWEKGFSKDSLEEQLIRNYLHKFQGNKSRVARELGISRSSLYRKLEKYSI